MNCYFLIFIYTHTYNFLSVCLRIFHYMPSSFSKLYLCILLHQVSGSSQEDKCTQRYQSDFCKSCLLIHSHGDLLHTHLDLGGKKKKKSCLNFLPVASVSEYNFKRKDIQASLSKSTDGKVQNL